MPVCRRCGANLLSKLATALHTGHFCVRGSKGVLRPACLPTCTHVAVSVPLHAHRRDTRYDADMEEALVSSKLDAIGQEYNLLLAGQLEEQRRWFEGRHAQVTRQ
jgi:hypothetical protein